MLRDEVLTNQLTCPVCGAATAAPTHDECCEGCDAILRWFQNRLELSGYRPISRVSLTSSFAVDLAIDSLDVIEVICDLERDFAIAITGEDALRITTIGDAVACVRRHKSDPALTKVASPAPRRGLPVAPARLVLQLSKFLVRPRRPR